MNYGIKRIIKEKKFSNGKIIMAELFGCNLYGVLVFDENENLIDSLCNCCFSDDMTKKILKLTRTNYKEKIKEWFYRN